MPRSPEAVKNQRLFFSEDHLLNEQEFLDLITLSRTGSPEAREQIIKHNLRLVMSVAQRFAGRGELDDLFQLGCLGLLKAVARFDPEYGVRFSTYAVPLIIGEIKQYLRDAGPIKMSRTLKENAYRTEQVRNGIRMEQGREPTLTELATATGLLREEIVEAMEASLPVNSMQDYLYEDGPDGCSREQFLGEEGEQYQWLEHYALEEAIAMLPKRLQQLIQLRFFEEKTQQEVAALFGVSQVQICRLEKAALQQLRSCYSS